MTTAPGTHNTKQITFFVASDTHFGHIDVQGQDARLKNMWTIDAMHSTPGRECHGHKWTVPATGNETKD